MGEPPPEQCLEEGEFDGCEGEEGQTGGRIEDILKFL
jgi:hypothetical protein